MIIVFVAALSLAGGHFGRTFAEGLRLRFDLKEANLRLTEANLRLQAEMAEHRETEAALHQAQKLEAMGHLVGGIAHDFSNLLIVVAANATLLCYRAADEPTRRRAAAILSVADRGQRLIRQLLAFSRSRMLRPQLAARGHRRDDRSARRSVASDGRSWGIRTRLAQYRGKRPRRHAEWRRLPACGGQYSVPRRGCQRQPRR